nr:MAG TPA: hypothetical protein [Caudoviricetes sp.]
MPPQKLYPLFLRFLGAHSALNLLVVSNYFHSRSPPTIINLVMKKAPPGDA